MLFYILKRIALMVPTLLGALTITFVVIQFVPGGPVEQIMAEARASQKGGGDAGLYKAGRDSDAKQIAELKKLYGFDKPAHVRYFEMLGSFLRFDLGRSFLHNKDVWQLIKEKLPVSISLGLWTFLISYLISVPLGVAKAVREGSRFDVMTSLVVLIGYAIPGFVLGIFLIVLFAGGSFFEWFPLRGLTSDNWDELSWPARIADYFWHLTLPLICLVISSFAVTTMLTKNTFVEEMRKQYVLVARAKGLSQQQRALQAHLPQRADPAGHRLSGGLRRRLLRRLGADRDAVLARRPGPAVLRVGGAARLSGGAGLAVPVHADRAGGQAGVRPAVRGGRPARAVRGSGQMRGAR